MKGRMISLAASAALFVGLGSAALAAGAAPGLAGAQPHLNSLARSYLAADQLLAHDRLDGVAADFATIGHCAENVVKADPALAAEAGAVRRAAQPHAATLKEARTSFKALSAAVISLLKTAPPSAAATGTLYTLHCPMAQADWLQTSKVVANPYLGQAMGACGTVTGTIHTK